MAQNAVAEIVAPGEARRGAVGPVLDPGEKAAEPSDRDCGGERRGKAQSGRAAQAGAPFQELDRDDRAGDGALDAARRSRRCR